MYRITTRTGRTVHTGIDSLSEAIFKIRVLELNTKRAGIYSPGITVLKNTVQLRRVGIITKCAFSKVTILKIKNFWMLDKK